jgi:hypothetical protein
MTHERILPRHTELVTSYDRLARYARAFADGNIGLLVLIGRPGLGKSFALKDALAGSAHWIKGNTTPFTLYSEAYRHRKEPLVLDDVDGLCRTQQGIGLLKELCESDGEHTVTWRADRRSLASRGLPQQFTTRSHVAIIANRWKTGNADLSAVEDRGHFVHFAPTAEEIHRQARGWFSDREILRLVERNLSLMGEDFSLRVYTRAAEAKRARLDWKTPVLASALTGNLLHVWRLREDTSYCSEEARVAAFVDAGHGSRSTYYREKQKLERLAAARPRHSLARSGVGSGTRGRHRGKSSQSLAVFAPSMTPRIRKAR